MPLSLSCQSMLCAPWISDPPRSPCFGCVACVLSRQDDTVVVADFGLARSVVVRNRSFVDGDGQTLSSKRRLFRRHKCKTIVGNPYWMAPEMILGLTYDEKVDVFSFGMIVCEVNKYHLCHHHPHYTGDPGL